MAGPLQKSTALGFDEVSKVTYIASTRTNGARADIDTAKDAIKEKAKAIVTAKTNEHLE